MVGFNIGVLVWGMVRYPFMLDANLLTERIKCLANKLWAIVSTDDQLVILPVYIAL